ncbi:GTP 3',8-cyclase MoaA [Candidatus Bathyarchaeota archaeon]|nr:GTP 3',8-cyclase MoaA [Candidatus Bathyarchaeota archaeon]
MAGSRLTDGFNRTPHKLRISVTDRCNMRCIYCMPQKEFSWRPRSEILSYEEITRLAKIFVGLGIEKIRVTGGEPLVRPQIETLISSLGKIEGLKKLSLTTNGLLLGEKVDLLKDAGLRSVNVSLDTLNQDRFKAITGIDGFKSVRASLEDAKDAGFEVKINTVVMRGHNESEIEDFAKLALNEGFTVRFIEFMPLDGSRIWDPSAVVPKHEMIERITRNVAELEPQNNNPSDPARLYTFKGGKGVVGFIPSMSEPFCSACDRVRLTSDGKFLTCLFEQPTYDVKALLRGGKLDKEIEAYIAECYRMKPEGVVGIIRSKNLNAGLNKMNTIGG